MTGGRKRRFCKEGSLFVAGRENAQSQYCVHLAPSSYWVLELPQEAKPKFMMFYLIEVLIFISLMTNDKDHLFM